MNKLESKKQAAFEVLTGVEIGTFADSPPETIALPEYVHDRALSAVAATGGDFRERSLGFFHLKDRWRGSIAFKGTVFDGRGAKTSRLDRLMFIGSHIDFHTHPRFNRQHAEMSNRHYTREGYTDVPDIDAWHAFYEATYPLPSPSDMRVSIINATGNPSWLISSEGGHFLSVARKLDIGLSQWDKRKRAGIEAAEGFRAHCLDLLKGGSEKLTNARPHIIAEAARHLSPVYETYYSPDPSDPVLERIS